MKSDHHAGYPFPSPVHPPMAYPGVPPDHFGLPAELPDTPPAVPSESKPAQDKVRLSPMPKKTKQALRAVLGARCAEARKGLGLSQRALAKELDMSPSWVREVENGAQFAPAWLLVLLSEASGKPIGWFYGFGGAASPAPAGRRCGDHAFDPRKGCGKP